MRSPAHSDIRLYIISYILVYYRIRVFHLTVYNKYEKIDYCKILKFINFYIVQNEFKVFFFSNIYYNINLYKYKW